MAPSLQEKMENMKDNIKNKVDSKLLKVTGKPSSSSQASSTTSPTSTSTHTTHSDAARKSSSSSSNSTSSAPTSTITKSATGPNRSSSTSSSKPLASLIAAAKGDAGPGHYSSTSNTTNINNTKISNVNETEVHIVNNYYTMKQPDGQVLTKTVPRLVTSTRSVKTTQTVTAPPITVTMSLGGGLKTFTLTSHAAYPTGGAHVGGLHFGKNRNKGALNNDSDLLASADPGAAKGLGKDDVASANSVMRVAASSAGWGGAPAATATSKAQSLAALWGVGDDDKADGDDKDDDAKEDGGASPTPAASASSSSASATATTSCGDTDINCLLAQLTASPTSTSSSSSSSAKATSTGLGKAGHETKKLLATKQHQSGISTGFIIAIVAFALAALLLIFGLIMACRRSGSRKRKNDNEWRRTPPQMTQQPTSSVPYAYGGVGNSAQPPANYRTMSRSSMDQGPGQAPAISINVNGGGDPFHDRNAMGHARSGSSASRQTVPPIDENDYYRGPAARNEANGGGAPRWPDASRNQAPPAPGTQSSLRSLPYKTSTPQPLPPSHPTALPTLPVPQGGSAANSSLAAPHSRTSLPSFYSTASANDEWNGRQDQMHPVPKIPQAYENRHDLA